MKRFKELLVKLFSVFPNILRLGNTRRCVTTEENVKLYPKYALSHVSIGKCTYISRNSDINYTIIGRFCSIGPNFNCGLGIHPTNGISTAPCFYSTKKQNGMTFSSVDKAEELKYVHIGNDVFIGANVTILSDLKIGDGAIIAAGAVVTKDVPPYAIVGGVPAKIIKYRFDSDTIRRFLQVKWWNFDDDKLKLVEKYYSSPKEFFESIKINE